MFRTYDNVVVDAVAVGEYDVAAVVDVVVEKDQGRAIQSVHSFPYWLSLMFAARWVVVYTMEVPVRWRLYIWDTAMFLEYHH